MRPVIDQGRSIDWSATSVDYAAFRPGPPDAFFDRLQALGIGLPGQRILDLGTGTGVMARAFARRGAVVAGIDIAAGQIEAARQLAESEGSRIDFRVAPAEEPPFAARSFEAATANPCFLYFDRARLLAALRRVLVPEGQLAISHYSWLPRLDPIARASEALILEFNPAWEGADFDGRIAPVPEGLPDDLVLEGFFWFDVDVPFERAAWLGRIRASRGVGATLPPEDLAAFDRAHAALLARIAPPAFTIRHRLDARILRFLA
jgi:SAM-dependent methyltransferase